MNQIIFNSSVQYCKAPRSGITLDLNQFVLTSKALASVLVAPNTAQH